MNSQDNTTRKPSKGLNMHLTWWNSIETISILSTLSRCAVPILGVLVVVFGMRESKLKSDAQAVERAISSKEIREAHQKITALQPKPLKVRIRDLLDQIDPKIIPAVQAGRFGFEGGITPPQYDDLLRIAREPGAEQFITVDPDVKTGLGTGPGGSNTYGVTFRVYPKILDNE